MVVGALVRELDHDTSVVRHIRRFDGVSLRGKSPT